MAFGKPSSMRSADSAPPMDGAPPPREPVAKGDFYEDGFSGKDGAASARDRLAAYFGLPPGMTSGALLSAINVIADRPAYKKAVEEIKND